MPNTTYNKALKPYAQKLRREMTREEQHLWYQFLKPQGIKAKRQQIISTFIVDFYIPSAGIVIEIDGSQHYEQEAQIRDHERDPLSIALAFSYSATQTAISTSVSGTFVKIS